MNNLPLNKFSKNIHSQNGEDGIIAQILNKLELSIEKNLWCVEFGAWDGMHHSNTFTLVENGWNAVYIEGESERYQDLLKTQRKFPKILPVEAFVAKHSGEENSLDNILAKTGIPKNFEVLSIDIDSYDCDVWEFLSNYEPKIVIIEINSSAPPGVLWRHSDRTPGNTFSSTLAVGIKKGYTLICHTGNLIFVKSDLVDKLKIPKKYIDYPELLFINDWLPNDSFIPVTANRLIRVIIPKPLWILAKKIKNLLG